MKRIHLTVSGLVQGVGYRASVHSRIRHLPVTGYVRNMPDGTVEIVAEGENEALQAVVQAAQSGSPYSVVQHIAELHHDATGEYADFSIKR